MSMATMRWLFVTLVATLPQSFATAEPVRNGLLRLENELAVCSAYYALASETVQRGSKSHEAAGAASDLKAASQQMLTRALMIARLVELADQVVMRQVTEALERFVKEINDDPARSLEHMDKLYGRPCDTLERDLVTRYNDLIGR